MSVPKLDPRYNRDRIYQYAEYKVLAATFGRKKPRAWYEILSPFNRGKTKARFAIRLLPYKLAFATGILLLFGSLAVMAALQADTARLDYTGQEYSANLASLDQSIQEAVGAIIEAEGEVFSGGIVPPSEIVYPAVTKYLVLTNIPSASGKTLVRELYPLSKKLISLEP